VERETECNNNRGTDQQNPTTISSLKFNGIPLIENITPYSSLDANAGPTNALVFVLKKCS
jgi:hypothetical protein